MTLRSQLESAERQLRETREELDRLKRQTKPRFDLPPRWIIKAAKDALGRVGYWSGALAVLSSYYGVPHMDARNDPSKVSEKADATYYQYERTAYFKSTNGSGVWLVMHEFGHHLNAYLLDKIGGEAEQAFCDAFAFEMQKEWEQV